MVHPNVLKNVKIDPLKDFKVMHLELELIDWQC